MTYNETQKQRRICISYIILYGIAVLLTLSLIYLSFKLNRDFNIDPITRKPSDPEILTKPTPILVMLSLFYIGNMLLCIGIGITLFVLQIVIILGINKSNNSSIMIILIIGFFIPILSLIGSILAILHYNNTKNKITENNYQFHHRDDDDDL